MLKNLFNWLALLRTPTIGPVKFKQYLSQDPLLERLPKIACDAISHSKDLIKQDLKWAEQPDCHIMLLSDNDYPKLLREISSAPPILFIKGNKELLSKAQVAMVGSRGASNIGKQTASRFAAELSRLNFVVTSGLALGIDTASHQGALSVGKNTTIAVLGQGLNMIYPKQNCKLADSIVFNSGALVSEFPTGVMPLAINFPRRNRIISGLSLGVVVIEASINSGSLITVNYALEQGKEIFAVPGSIYDQNVQGCHKLIKQGAKLVENVAEIVEDLGFINNRVSMQHNNAHLVNNVAVSSDLNMAQQKILDSVTYATTAVDIIINRSGLTPSVVTATLVNLEFSGYITAVSGGYARLL